MEVSIDRETLTIIFSVHCAVDGVHDDPETIVIKMEFF